MKTFRDTKKLVKEDFIKVLTHPCIENSLKFYLLMLRYLFTNNSFKFCFWFRIASWSKKKKILLPLYILAWLMHRHYMYKYGIQLGIGTNIAGGLSFNHFSCIVINGSTVIGRNCTIFHGTTCALKIGGSKHGIPTIGDNCVLGPGCKILGNVKIGNNVFIGANAVVTHDVPSNAVVAGVPAKIINMNGEEATRLVRIHK